MGYEDRLVDILKTNYLNIKRPKSKISNTYHKTRGADDYLNEKMKDKHFITSSNSKNPKKKKEFECKKNFKFSKYHFKYKRALYDYQIEECKQGLKDDAIKQMDYIFDLIENCSNKQIIKCKIDEINKFIDYYNMSDDSIQEKRNVMIEAFKMNFG